MVDGEAFFLVDDREVVITPHRDVACDGGGGPLGHPVEYMTLGKSREVVCKYCDRRYVAADHPDAEAIRRDGTPYVSHALA